MHFLQEIDDSGEHSTLNLMKSFPENDIGFVGLASFETASDNSDVPPEPLFLEIPFYDPDDLEDDLERFEDNTPSPLSHEISFYDPDNIPDWI
jgi:hypothetical protein